MIKENLFCLNETYEELLRGDSFLKVFLENSHEAIAIFESDTGKMVLVNEKLAQLFKCPMQEIVSTEPFSFLPEFQPDGTSSQELALMHFNELTTKDRISYSWQQKAKDGTLFFTSITGLKVNINKCDLIIVIHNDLTKEIESEKKIGAEREQFNFLFDNAYDGILIYDTIRNKHTDCNERLLSYFEVESRKEILDEYWSFSAPIQWGNKELKEAKLELIKKIEKERKLRYKWIHKTKKGRKVISEITSMHMTEPNEHIRISILKDITQEQNALTELESNKRELLNAQSISKMASFKYEVNADRLTWSEYAYSILGMDANNAPTRIKDFITSLHKNDRKQFVEALFKGGNNKENIESEFRIYDSNGNIIYCHFRAETTMLDGKHIFIGSVQDVTEQKLGLLKLSQTNTKYIDLFDNMYDALLIVDKEGNFNDGNIAAERLLGYSKEELKSIKIPDIVYEEDREKSMIFLEKLLKNGYYSDYTGRIVRKDGDIRHIQVNSTAIYKDGEFAGSRDIARDITNIKEAEAKREELLEQLEKVNLELKNFAYLVSHDLKAPLRAISSLSTWLIEDYQSQLEESGVEKLKLLHSRVNRMHSFIDAILEYSKLGRIASKVEHIDLNLVIKEIEELINPPSNFKIKIPRSLPFFHGDKTRLTQLFQNLIGNSIKYNDKAQGEVIIEWEQVEDHIKFCVKDNGPGIEEKDYDRIFQIFQTLHSRDEIESTGIGLTIVKRIVNLYHGDIKIQSEIGKGTCFKFELYEENSKVKAT